MEDSRIIDLYWQRSEEAIRETDAKYGSYCHAIAYRILRDGEDARECVNDTWLGAWNAMPPHRPTVLSTFLGKITRRVSINLWNCKHADRRGGGELPLALAELEACIPHGDSPEQVLEERELSRLLSRFVLELPVMQRRVFLRRYWYLDSIEDIGRKTGFSRSKVKSMLHRTRQKLRIYLEKEGVL